MKRSLRILVVDDDVDNANSLGELFEMEGHRPLVVYDGEAAIAAYLKEDFDIAFMDVMMPGKNGVESFLEIKKLKPLAKVYMMTGYSVEQLLQQAIDGGNGRIQQAGQSLPGSGFDFRTRNVRDCPGG